MGEAKRPLFEQKGDFSPKKVVYPQFSTSYPHHLALIPPLAKD